MAWLKKLRPFKLIKPALPNSLFARVLFILIAPVVLLCVVTTYVFFDSHLDRITRQLADNIAGDVSSIVRLYETEAMSFGALKDFALTNHQLILDRGSNESSSLPALTPVRQIGSWFIDDALSARLPYETATSINSDSILMYVTIDGDITLSFKTPRKRLLMKRTPVYLMWLLGLPFLLFIIAAFFMKNQVRPILQLAKHADKIGKGLYAKSIKPNGATEVRQAIQAFNRMRESIKRHVTQRTEMLAGISHDLRTPLTRMELELAMLEDSAEVKELKRDVKEMRDMVESFLAFAKGEGPEKPVVTNVYDLMESAAEPFKEKINISKRISARRQVKALGLKRAFKNILSNADHFASQIDVDVVKKKDEIVITINDNGPGIPANQRKEAFKPFQRLDSARNQDHAGVGLGLAIARDAIHQHGGRIDLGDSDTGGLKVVMKLPL